mmetsp:Transcript_19284/g.33286  ORF Transcript_19284/g.33286 Transcript_19284/m.33286 type:complete len:115 (+) Transcript_19284:153-497(+)
MTSSNIRLNALWNGLNLSGRGLHRPRLKHNKKNCLHNHKHAFGSQVLWVCNSAFPASRMQMQAKSKIWGGALSLCAFLTAGSQVCRAPSRPSNNINLHVHAHIKLQINYTAACG